MSSSYGCSPIPKPLRVEGSMTFYDMTTTRVREAELQTQDLLKYLKDEYELGAQSGRMSNEQLRPGRGISRWSRTRDRS